MKVVIRVPDRQSALFPGWGPSMRWLWIAVMLNSTIAAIILAWVHEPQAPGAPPADRLVENAVEPAPVDGGLIVYATTEGNSNGQPSLWLYGPGGSRRLTPEGAGDFSPDVHGESVVYANPRGIYTLKLAGGTSTFIAGRGREPRFSPDGKRLAWTTNSGVEIDGKLAGPGLSRPVWIDNETLIGERAGAWWIAGKGGVRQLSAARGVAQFVRDGAIHYSRGGTLWRAPLQGGTATAVAEHRDGIAWARAARDGSLVFSTEIRRQDAWSLPMDGDTLAVRGGPERMTADGNVTLPAMSGDGRKLVYVTEAEGAVTVWVRAIERGGKDRITTLNLPTRRPVLNYDGSQIALPVRDGGGCRISVSSTVVFARTATVSECATVWDWAADGRRLLVAGDNPLRRTLELATPSGRTVVIDDPERDIAHAHFGPTGRYVTFTAGRPGEPRRTYFAPLPSSTTVDELAWVEIPGSDGGYPAWSPNGLVLYYRSAGEIWAQKLDTAKRPAGKPIRALKFGSREFSMAAVAPDDFHLSVSRERLVFNAIEIRGDIWKTVPR